MKYEKKLELTKRKFHRELGQFIGTITLGVHQVRQSYGTSTVCVSGAEALSCMLCNFEGTGKYLSVGKAWDEGSSQWHEKIEDFWAVREEVRTFWNSL